MLANFENVLDRLNVASRNGEKAMTFCPAHDDRNSPSLSLKAEDDKLLLNCFAACRPENIVSKIGLGMKDLFSEGEGGLLSPRTRLHAQGEKLHSNGQNGRASGGARSKHGCTLKEYSEEKKLPSFRGRRRKRHRVKPESGARGWHKSRTSLDASRRILLARASLENPG
jgi:hypothetical protein